MSEKIEALLSIASDSIVPIDTKSFPQSGLWPASSNLACELIKLLEQRNGFYAFETALLVRPVSSQNEPLGLVEWNNLDMWKSEYKVNLSQVLFFAEDIFGCQFCIKNDAIHTFDPETGELHAVANTFEEWAHWILADYRVRTGCTIVDQWRQKYGEIEAGQRLVPKVPFVLGGKFAVENLYKLKDTDGMCFRASIANQLRDCPDGTKVVLHTKWSTVPGHE